MISNYLSLVEALRPASDELAAQVARFLAGGGQIEEAAPIGYKPKPITYSNQMPPALKPFVRRRVEATPLPPALKRYTPAGTRRACRAYSGTGSHAHANGGIGCLGPEPAHPLQLREGVRHRLQEANPGRRQRRSSKRTGSGPRREVRRADSRLPGTGHHPAPVLRQAGDRQQGLRADHRRPWYRLPKTIVETCRKR